MNRSLLISFFIGLGVIVLVNCQEMADDDSKTIIQQEGQKSDGKKLNNKKVARMVLGTDKPRSKKKVDKRTNSKFPPTNCTWYMYMYMGIGDEQPATGSRKLRQEVVNQRSKCRMCNCCCYLDCESLLFESINKTFQSKIASTHFLCFVTCSLLTSAIPTYLESAHIFSSNWSGFPKTDFGHEKMDIKACCTHRTHTTFSRSRSSSGRSKSYNFLTSNNEQNHSHFIPGITCCLSCKYSNVYCLNHSGCEN